MLLALRRRGLLDPELGTENVTGRRRGKPPEGAKRHMCEILKNMHFCDAVTSSGGTESWWDVRVGLACNGTVGR